MSTVNTYTFSQMPFRIVTKDDKKYFVIRDICNYLGLGNPNRELAKHTRPDFAGLRKALLWNCKNGEKTLTTPYDDIIDLRTTFRRIIRRCPCTTVRHSFRRSPHWSAAMMPLTDELKSGGKYVTVSGEIFATAPAERTLTMSDGRIICTSDIQTIT